MRATISGREDGRPRFDLQSHSIHSDGALSPSEVIAQAQAAGVELLALSDHDTVSGVQEALIAGRALGVSVVPAVEVTAIHGRYEDLHIVGYGIDHRSPELLDALSAYRRDREGRADRMRAALEQLGFAVDEQLLNAQASSGGSVGRPHLARAVFEHPANAERLRSEGLGNSVELLQAYLLPGRAAYRGRTVPTAPEAIALIHAAGGVAIWAHPFWDIKDADEVLGTLDAFVDYGIDGVESFYVTHDEAQVALLARACDERGLLSTGSSDFHGPDHGLFSAFRGHELYGLEPKLGAIPSFAATDPAVERAH
jgi:predicted metal-dependent phosphoesterase TrpH